MPARPMPSGSVTRLLGALAVSLAMVSAPAPSARAGATPVAAPALSFERYVLSNGLEVILHEDHKTPLVAVNVWYHVGSKDEPAGKNGFAHLFEHVMFQGSKHVAEDTFFKYLERAGSSDRNGTTNTDRTNYYETLPSNELALALWLESDRMGWLLDHANDDTFKSQRDVVKNERRQNYENAPYGLVIQFIREALYPKDHPYHRLTIGTPQDLDAASFQDVTAFFRTWYLPNNATLVVAGDIDKKAARALIAQYFEAIPRGPDPKPAKGPTPVKLDHEKRLEVEADVELARVVVTWPTPPQFAPGDGELDLLAEVLSSGKTSRLFKRLVYDLQIAQDVSAYQGSSMLSSQFEVVVTVKKGKDPKTVLKLVDEELAKVREKPPTDDELARAKAKILSNLIFDAERITSRANAFNAYAHATGDPGWFDKDVARYERATAADLSKTAATWLAPDKRIVTIVLPKKGAPRAGRLLEVKP
ncbi:MAG: insulinase family protein [Deltaproteobacteria bacterium]|nr:insulinase family protein [Deltaproteobacteria bacterium]